MPMDFVAGRVWPAMLTPLDEDGHPHESNTRRLADVLAEQQLGGLFVLGSTGQGVLLSTEDRKRAAEWIVRTVDGRIPVMVHVGATTTDEAIELARHAEQVGADAISSVPPIYYPLSAEAVLEHYRRIGQATGLPFFPYHASFLNQALPSAHEYADRLLEIPNIAGMKFTDHDLYQMELLHAYSGGRLNIFSGADELLCHAALSGAVGAIGTFYNQWGEACQRVREAFVAGDFQHARAFMIRFGWVIDTILRSQNIWGFHRLSMRLKYGIDVGRPRAPLGTVGRGWTEAEVEGLIEQVEDAAAAAPQLAEPTEGPGA